VSEYNVTFFAFDNKVIYVDHEKSDAVYDTGLSLTAETTLFYNTGPLRNKPDGWGLPHGLHGSYGSSPRPSKRPSKTGRPTARYGRKPRSG